MILTNTLLCLALTIYHEARGESITGQTAVAHVVVNRAEEKSIDYCQVIKEKNQFNFVVNGKAPNPTESEKFIQAVYIADEVSSNRTKDPTKGSLYFWNTKLGIPGWAKCKKPIKIGNHYFC